ncbi:MAG: NAD-dependent epimerase/dehydratase family protein [Planctomycetaceae bacterium]|jgi:farnesol dehydrogenase|nr:NAD-dependent epimerase/dehydratase family protein [Planctomycetaceae bacterium]
MLIKSGVRVFITGGTGFIGSRLTAELLQRGCLVNILTRKPPETSDIPKLVWAVGFAPEQPLCDATLACSASGISKQLEYNNNIANTKDITYVQGDVTDVDSLRRGMSGCKYVFHLAAYAKNWARDKKIFKDINITGTRNVFNVAREVGVERVVWTSTIVTFGPTGLGVVGDENTIRSEDRFFTEYEESKTLMEREALELAAGGLPLVVVNPSRVYGPGLLSESNSVTRLISMIRNGRMPVVFNYGRNIGNYVYVDDVVSGLILALERGRVGERYILGGDNISLGELFSIVDKVDGIKRFRWGIYYLTPFLIAYISERMANIFGLYPMFTRGWLKTFLTDWAFSSNKAETELGYKPTPFKEGIRKTCQWLDEYEKKKT